MKKLAATAAALGLLAPAALAATSHYVKVSPKSVTAGYKVRVYGAVGTICKPGSRVTLVSKAFKGSTKHSYAGVPAVWTTVTRTHQFSTHVLIQSTTPGSTYRIGARCGGVLVGRTSLMVLPFY